MKKIEKLKVNYLPIGSAGILPVNLPYLTIGSGYPRGVIIALQHGMETISLWVLNKLLQKKNCLSGTAIIVPVANPFGFALGTRNEILDGKDLNRLYPGDSQGDFSARLTQALVGLCLQADFVLDLHSFSRQAPFLAGYSRQVNRDQTAVKKILRLIKPDAVWAVNDDDKTGRYLYGSLDSYLTKKNIPIVFLEMSNNLTSQSKIPDRIADSIFRVFQGFKNKKVNNNALLSEYAAKYLYANESGLFEPVITPLKKVKTGQIIGYVYVFPEFKRAPVKCRENGIILTIRSKGIVRTGSKICSIGITD